MTEQESETSNLDWRTVVRGVGRLTGIVLVGALIIVAVAVWRDPLRWRLAAQDFFVLANHQPTAQEKRWTDELQLTDDGRDTMYAAHPEIIQNKSFGEVCPTKEETNVLGCYLTTSKIYVLDVEEPSIEGVETVTLAHEVLHAEWDRLPINDKQQLEQQLLNYYRNVDDDQLTQLISGYRRSAPAGQADAVTATELHSILATEYSDLPDELEQHFSRFFKDRQAVVGTYRSYEDQFESRRQRAAKLSQELESLQSDIEQRGVLIDRQIERNEDLIAQIEQLRGEGRVEESNELVPVQNGLVDQINTNITELNQQIERFNSLRTSYQQVSVELNQLFDSLNTRDPVQ